VNLGWATRARSVPDRTVISGESRSLTDTPRWRSPVASQVERPALQSLQARDHGLLGPASVDDLVPGSGSGITSTCEKMGQSRIGWGNLLLNAEGAEPGGMHDGRHVLWLLSTLRPRPGHLIVRRAGNDLCSG
jgi:hypothetical protein